MGYQITTEFYLAISLTISILIANDRPSESRHIDTLCVERGGSKSIALIVNKQRSVSYLDDNNKFTITIECLTK